MSMGVCYVNMQNLKEIYSRGTEIDAVKVEASFSKKIGLRQGKKRIKIDPFTPENSAFPEFPVEFSTDFLFLLAL